jgi:high-affinity K+ transport system ATPase subunit B
MTSTTNAPTAPLTGADAVGEELAEHYDRGVAIAAQHATRASLIDPTRSGLSSWTYARRMSDTMAEDGDTEQSAYWAGYSAEARRIDPDSTRRLHR